MMTDLEIVAKRGFCNGWLQSHWYANEQLIWSPGDDDGECLTWRGRVPFPFNLRVELQGKNMQQDTVVSDQGEILQDKYLRLQSLRLARCPIKTTILKTICRFKNHLGVQEENTYFWSNGQAIMQFDARDPVHWHLLYNELT